MRSRDRRFIVQVCMGYSFGGPHMYLLRIAQEAARRGYHNIIATNRRSALASSARRLGFDVLAIEGNDRGSFWHQVQRLSSGGRVLAVHLHSIRGLPRGFISLPSDIPLLLTEHSYRFRDVLHPLSRMALSRVDHVLAISEAVAEVNGKALGINPERMRVLHHGVNLARFHPEQREKDRRRARARFEIRQDDEVVVVPTTFKRVKNLFRMVEVLDRMRRDFPGLKLLLTGDFTAAGESREYKRELTEKIEERGLGGRVRFTGFLDHIEEAYAAADVVTVPTEFEAFGLPALEAMGAGLPVIGSKLGAFPEIVQDQETGICLDVNDLDAWVEALTRILTDRAYRDRLSSSGRRRAEDEFSITDHWNQLFDLYAEGRVSARARAPA